MSFSEQIDSFVSKCKVNSNQVVRKTLLDIGKSLIEKTPVGDPSYWKSPPPKGYSGGHARANWSYSMDTLNTQEYADIDKTGNVSVQRIVGSIPPDAAGHTHFIQNSVPYIQALEDGHSRQCPPNGMVGLTVIEFQDTVKKIMDGLK